MHTLGGALWAFLILIMGAGDEIGHGVDGLGAALESGAGWALRPRSRV